MLQWKGIVTVKADGAYCIIINGKFYKHYDAKKGKSIPQSTMKCQKEPGIVTEVYALMGWGHRDLWW